MTLGQALARRLGLDCMRFVSLSATAVARDENARMPANVASASRRSASARPANAPPFGLGNPRRVTRECRKNRERRWMAFFSFCVIATGNFLF